MVGVVLSTAYLAFTGDQNALTDIIKEAIAGGPRATMTPVIRRTGDAGALTVTTWVFSGMADFAERIYSDTKEDKPLSPIDELLKSFSRPDERLQRQRPAARPTAASRSRIEIDNPEWTSVAVLLVGLLIGELIRFPLKNVREAALNGVGAGAGIETAQIPVMANATAVVYKPSGEPLQVYGQHGTDARGVRVPVVVAARIDVGNERYTGITPSTIGRRQHLWLTGAPMPSELIGRVFIFEADTMRWRSHVPPRAMQTGACCRRGPRAWRRARGRRHGGRARRAIEPRLPTGAPLRYEPLLNVLRRAAEAPHVQVRAADRAQQPVRHHRLREPRRAGAHQGGHRHAHAASGSDRTAARPARPPRAATGVALRRRGRRRARGRGARADRRGGVGGQAHVRGAGARRRHRRVAATANANLDEVIVSKRVDVSREMQRVLPGVRLDAVNLATVSMFVRTGALPEAGDDVQPLVWGDLSRLQPELMAEVGAVQGEIKSIEDTLAAMAESRGIALPPASRGQPHARGRRLERAAAAACAHRRGPVAEMRRCSPTSSTRAGGGHRERSRARLTNLV